MSENKREKEEETESGRREAEKIRDALIADPRIPASIKVALMGGDLSLLSTESCGRARKSLSEI